MAKCTESTNWGETGEREGGGAVVDWTPGWMWSCVHVRKVRKGERVRQRRGGETRRQHVPVLFLGGHVSSLPQLFRTH